MIATLRSLENFSKFSCPKRCHVISDFLVIIDDWRYFFAVSRKTFPVRKLVSRAIAVLLSVSSSLAESFWQLSDGFLVSSRIECRNCERRTRERVDVKLDTLVSHNSFILYGQLIAELLWGRRPQEWSPILMLRGMLVFFYGHGKRNG